jgi:hypothetical protein
MKARFISRYGIYGKLAGNSPTTAAATQMRPSTAGGLPGSPQNAEAQIRQSPQPFSGGGALRNRPVVNQSRLVTNPQGLPSARGTRPGNYAAAAPQSDPMDHSSMMKFSGHPPNYAPKQGYSPAISGRLKPGRTRIMRGAVPGSKPFVKPMSNDDFLEGAALYRKDHGKL